MPSPFPGMDPYVEANEDWQDFHQEFISACRSRLNRTLPRDYVARVGERVQMVVESPDPDDPDRRHVLPDVALTRRPAADGDGSGGGGVATLEPVALPQPAVFFDRPKQRFIEVVRYADERLVTTIEVLSPTNKRPGADRTAYLSKRSDLLLHDVHLVEVDLLVEGRRLPMGASLPAGDHFAFVTRWPTPERCDVYGWPLRDPLPTVPVPLEEGVADVPLDLAAAFADAYDRGGFERLIRYDGRPLPAGLSEGDRAWAASIVAGR